MSDFERTLEDEALIGASLNRAVQQAVLTHAKLGHAVPAARNGQVVWISPSEILRQFQPGDEPWPTAN